MEYMEITELIPKVVFKDEQCDFKDELWKQIAAKCFVERESATVSLHRPGYRLLWRIAACVAVVAGVGLGVYLSSQKTIAASNEELTFNLPDRSTVTLFAGSTLKYNKVKWLFGHDVSLDGKAKFSGDHANGFSVKTSEGTVSVLGTEFLVDEQNNSLYVECFTGSVQVATQQGKQILHEGERVTFSQEGKEFLKVWSEYEAIDNVSLKEAMQLITEIYEVEVEGVEKYADYTYSGAIPTGNLEEALELVLGSCNISFKISNGVIVIH